MREGQIFFMKNKDAKGMPYMMIILENPEYGMALKIILFFANCFVFNIRKPFCVLEKF